MVFGPGTYDIGQRKLIIKYRGTAANPITLSAVDGANIVFTRNGQQNVINLHGAQHLKIIELEITGGDRGIAIGNDGHIDSKFITLDGNHIHHTGDAAVTANNVNTKYEGMHFIGNHIHDTGGHGEGFYVGCNDNKCQFFNGIIEKNYIHDLNDLRNGVYQGDGIEIKHGSYNNIIRDNVIHDTNYPAITAYGVERQGGRNVIERNVMWDIDNHGIQVAADANVRNNIIFSSLYDGIHIQNHQAAVPGNLTIVNNTIRSNVGNNPKTSYISGHAIRITNPNGGTYSGPILLANNALYPEGSEQAIHTYLAPPGITSINNVGTGIAPELPFDSTGNLIDDFVDFLNKNAFPTVGSSLIGAANTSFQPNNDFNTTSRSGSNDVGAYAYRAGGNPGWQIGPKFKEFPAIN